MFEVRKMPGLGGEKYIPLPQVNHVEIVIKE